MLKPADVLASNGRGVVREVRVAVFAVIPRHDERTNERTNERTMTRARKVAFSFALCSFFLFFVPFFFRVFFFCTNESPELKRRPSRYKEIKLERDHFLCNFNTLNITSFLSPLLPFPPSFCLCCCLEVSAKIRRVKKRGSAAREKRREREREKKERESA